MIQKLIQWLLRSLRGISKEQWLQAVDWVLHLMDQKHMASESKGNTLRLWLADKFKTLRPSARNLLAEMAYSYVQDKQEKEAGK